MSVILNQKYIIGEEFYNSNIPTALRNALKDSKNGGFVASMPQLIHGKVIAPKDNDIWKKWYTAFSEEDLVITPQGGKYIVDIHGGGILMPDRINQALEEENGLINGAARFSDDENKSLVNLINNGELSDGTEIPVYTVKDIREGISDLPKRFVYVVDFNNVGKSDYLNKKEFMKSDLVIARIGSVSEVESYFDKAIRFDKKVGNWHRFKNIGSDVPQGRLLYLNYGNYGPLGYNDLYYDGRFVGVAPEVQVASENLVITPELERILEVVNPFVAEVNGKELREALKLVYKR
ncbi:MAG: hypothetical protein ISS82_03045 [Nanoarchaeota archaeon]|nr:hypothetical protein [Nanoarchaeota archaeon]